MNTYTNAIGYLIELRNEVNISWFTKICDLVLDAENNNIDESEFGKLIKIFTEDEDYTSVFVVNQIVNNNASSSSVTNDRIEKLYSFDNFKGISSDLDISIDKKITLFFGTNGSGKSSICEALKILGSPNKSKSPFRNVKTQSSTIPKFKYKFQSNTLEEEWDTNKGLGLFSNKLKFFDAKLAVRYIDNPMSPEQTIEITPFKLEMFKYLRDYLSQFQNKLNQIINSQKDLFNQQLRLLNDDVEKLKVDNYTLRDFILNGDIERTENFLATLNENEIQERIKLKKIEEQEFLALSTIEGVEILKRDITDREKWIKDVKQFIHFIDSIEIEELQSLFETEKTLRKEQEDILLKISDDKNDFMEFNHFISSSKKLIENNDINSCPYCKQELDNEAKKLIDNYKKFLFSKTEEKLNRIQRDVSKKVNQLNRINTLGIYHIENIEALSEGIKETTNAVLQYIKASFPKEKEDLVKSDLVTDYSKELELLNNNLKKVSLSLQEDKSNYQKAVNQKDKIDEDYRKIKREIENLETQLECYYLKEDLMSITKSSKYIKNLNARTQAISFQGINQKITLKAKRAFNHLIVSGFEEKLTQEYIKLTEKSMSTLGVELVNKGSKGKVTLNPTVGQEPINIILSEGELKMHSLALFFCELETSNEDIIVIDDPVTSLDYNYVTTFVERLRDFVIANPNKQLIVFTHDWSFFEQLRDEFNKVNLHHQLEYKIIEKCALIKGFRDKLPQLKERIENTLSKSSLTEFEKKDLAGTMRILIERIVNKHVFAGEKYKYKKGSTSVSNYLKCTKLVPLLREEAIKFQDLYKKFSPFEHDDPRIWYIETDINQMKNRYDEIISLEEAIVRRKI